MTPTVSTFSARRWLRWLPTNPPNLLTSMRLLRWLPEADLDSGVAPPLHAPPLTKIITRPARLRYLIRLSQASMRVRHTRTSLCRRARVSRGRRAHQAGGSSPRAHDAYGSEEVGHALPANHVGFDEDADLVNVARRQVLQPWRPSVRCRPSAWLPRWPPERSSASTPPLRSRVDFSQQPSELILVGLTALGGSENRCRIRESSVDPN